MKFLQPKFAVLFFLFTVLCAPLFGDLYLRENLKKAKPGDYIVTYQNKNYTLLHIYSKVANILTIEEITVPEKRINPNGIPWKKWVQDLAPGNTSWVMYEIDLNDGVMNKYYSFSKKNWYDIPEADNFLTTLVNLKLKKIPESERKRVGHQSDIPQRSARPLWQPRMVVNGMVVEGVYFDGWKTNWPKDGSELSGKTIEVFLPQEDDLYPSYFPYWLQISGLIGKAKIRIIDSGSNLSSPMPALSAIH